MKNIILSVFILTSLHSFGQWTYETSSKNTQPAKVFTNTELYKIEYELTDESNLGDSTILSTINLERFDYVRMSSTDVTFFDKDINLEIIVYSFNKIRSIKYRKQPTLLENQ